MSKVVTITLPQGPTTMDEDQLPVQITRFCPGLYDAGTAQAEKLVEAAHVLGATIISIEDGK